MFQRNPAKKSAYQQAADALIAQLEAGTVPWRKPWTSIGMPRNLVSQKEYRGINVFLLAMQNYPSPYWLTFNQAKQLGGSIQKGAKGTSIMFWKPTRYTKKDSEGNEEARHGMICRGYTVFNLMQCNPELAEKLGLNKPQAPVEDLPAAEAIWANFPNRPTYKDSDKAFYRPSTDEIHMPLRTSFKEQREFYSTLFHEMVHSTGATKRLNRDGIAKLDTFGSEQYSAEELVAEFGSAMLCAVAGIQPSVVENQAAYIKTWLQRLKGEDNATLLIRAVSAAQKACDHIRVEVKSEEDSSGVDVAGSTGELTQKEEVA
jgi:antirestriction protein ArdC